MKTKFLSHLWSTYCQSVTAAIVDIYIHRHQLALSSDDEMFLQVLQDFTLRKDLSRNVFLCASFIKDRMDDDDEWWVVDQLCSESPRIENWNLVKFITPVLVDFRHTLSQLTA